MCTFLMYTHFLSLSFHLIFCFGNFFLFLLTLLAQHPKKFNVKLTGRERKKEREREIEYMCGCV